ncbi:50S ribosomal protein L33, putative [Plasmodium ovale]|uniref:50S ribosomal protein L33, putative n=1 Tax=Plasmodium ovale TaxID=36330 RepID=A0A1C3L531_PLAOA|nr:50S ribosomal protein L33, putative [Plasmodium ovale]
MKKCYMLVHLLFLVLITIKCTHQFVFPNNTIVIKIPNVKNICRSKRNVNIYAKKKNRKVVVIECTEARKYGKQPSRYVTEKNKVNTPKKLQLYKYNKYLKRRTLHVEIK